MDKDKPILLKTYTRCKTCDTNIYNMLCIKCAARHCKMMFYPPAMNKWEYVRQIAKKYGHEESKLIETIRGMKVNATSNKR